jgi:hypothetical protein
MTSRKAAHHASIPHKHAVVVFNSPSGDAVFSIGQTIAIKFRVARVVINWAAEIQHHL